MTIEPLFGCPAPGGGDGLSGFGDDAFARPPGDNPEFDGEDAASGPDSAAAPAPAGGAVRENDGIPAETPHGGGPGFLVFLVVALSLGVCAVAYRASRGADGALRQMVGQGYRPGTATTPGRPGYRPHPPPPTRHPAPVAGGGHDPARAQYAFERSRVLFQLARPLGAPRPGEWRAITRETPESFYRFVSQPQRPVFPPGRRTLVLTPVGDQSAGSWRSLEPVAEFMAAYFAMPARTAPPIPPQALPAAAWKHGARERKLVAEYCLTDVLRPRLPADGAIMVGLTAADLTPGGGWGFESAFGWSTFYGRAAIVSTARVIPGGAQRAPTPRELEHVVKLALHEACHAFALKHCQRHECLVNGRCSLEENARKPLWLCPECHAKLMYAVGFDPGTRAARLAALSRRYGFSAAANYYARAARLFPAGGR